MLVGMGAAVMNGWQSLQRYNDDRDRLLQMRFTYECAALQTEEILRPYANEFGNINVRYLCFTQDDFYVAPYELEAVRKGEMKFESAWKPFYPGQIVASGLFWAVGSVLFAIGGLSMVALARWVWGRSS